MKTKLIAKRKNQKITPNATETKKRVSEREVQQLLISFKTKIKNIRGRNNI